MAESVIQSHSLLLLLSYSALMMSQWYLPLTFWENKSHHMTS